MCLWTTEPTKAPAALFLHSVLQCCWAGFERKAGVPSYVPSRRSTKAKLKATDPAVHAQAGGADVRHDTRSTVYSCSCLCNCSCRETDEAVFLLSGSEHKQTDFKATSLIIISLHLPVKT